MSLEIRPSRTIAFVHGAFVSKHCWQRWVERCEALGYACIAMPYPGRDRSPAELRAQPDLPLIAKLTFRDVVEHHVATLRSLPEKPLVIGHSLGGLVAQLLVQREVASAAVAISSVPPQFVTTLAWSFLRSLWPVVNPLVPASRPYLMPLDHFRYAFANGMPDAEQRAAHDRYVVPESRRAARGALTGVARVDFKRAHAPLLFIAGEDDHLMPAALNRRNFLRYRHSPSVTDFVEFPGRNHLSIIGGAGWEQVLDHALAWAVNVRGLAPTPGATALHGG